MHSVRLPCSFALSLVLVAAWACERKVTPEKMQDAAPPAVLALVPAAAPSATVTPAKPQIPAGPAQTAMLRWNQAHQTRDASALADVYADSLEFYGRKISRQKVLALKAQAFKAAPDYEQELQSLKFTEQENASIRADFLKLWTQNKKPRRTQALLEFEKFGHGYRVVKETDALSEMRRTKPVIGANPCESAVLTLVSNTEPAHALLFGPTNPDAGHFTNGMRFGSMPPEEPIYSVAIHESHEDHLFTLGWFEVDPKTGTLRESKDDAEPFKADPELMRRVREACKTEEP